jgi:hypothetical protein
MQAHEMEVTSGELSGYADSAMTWAKSDIWRAISARTDGICGPGIAGLRLDIPPQTADFDTFPQAGPNYGMAPNEDICYTIVDSGLTGLVLDRMVRTGAGSPGTWTSTTVARWVVPDDGNPATHGGQETIATTANSKLVRLSVLVSRTRRNREYVRRLQAAYRTQN